jgi:hypothetical protein
MTEHDLPHSTIDDREDAHPAIAAAIKAMIEDGCDHRDVAQSLISGGLCHFAGTMCDAHCIVELEVAYKFIGDKLVELRGVN